MSGEIQVVILDADAVIALINKDDSHSGKAQKILDTILDEQIVLIYPATTIVEAITTVQRKLGKPDVANALVELVKASKFPIEAVDQLLIEQATVVFNPYGSKKNTFFDAVVSAVAKKYKTKYIFSFDKWYEKAGFTLVGDVLR